MPSALSRSGLSFMPVQRRVRPGAIADLNGVVCKNGSVRLGHTALKRSLLNPAVRSALACPFVH